MKKLFLMLFVGFAIIAYSQKMKFITGDLNFLKGQSQVSVVFDYSDLKLTKDNLPEKVFVENKVKALNQKVEGSGDAWEKQWNVAKEGIWNPSFITKANLLLEKLDTQLKLKENVESDYTLVVKVVWIYSGWDAAVLKQPSKVSTKLVFIDSKTKAVLTEIDSKEALGGNGTWNNLFNDEARIGEGFGSTGRMLAKIIYNKLR
ncbi:MAG: hypothetical protein E2590_14175 [Chryseobacterium sp.]|nr:hypothetical protein [Chryseobacterium sp.]